MRPTEMTSDGSVEILYLLMHRRPLTSGVATADDREGSLKDPDENRVFIVGVEAPARQGARSAHTGRM